MAMSILRFERENGEAAWGVVFGERIAPLPERFDTTGELIERGLAQAKALSPADATLALESVRLLAPVTPNQQFICQGINYRDHIRESGMKVENVPFNTIFTKAPSCITSARGAIVRPRHVQLLDYEIELGIVLGKRIDAPVAVTEHNLHEYAAALTVVNDISARDVQLPQGQFYKGKSYRGFGPVGPFLVFPTREEWRKLGALRMRLAINGEPRQDAYCEDMLHAPAQTLAELSEMHDLAPGDLLATGTPAGCAAVAPGKLKMAIFRLLPERRKWALFIGKSLSNPHYLKPGDRMTASIRCDDGSLDLGEQCHVIEQG
jgi:2-keto-4-pentenoate hydratase/2-oxohepta-3-ene-1,7-dioic acid hydratase in catechol pathway